MLEFRNMEELIKKIIRENLKKRIAGHGDIDTVLSNEELIGHWVSAIVALGYNGADVEQASHDINEFQIRLIGTVSLEDTRAFVYLASHRFQDEISAFMKYLELRDSETEDAILYAVKEEMSYVEEGDFMLS